MLGKSYREVIMNWSYVAGYFDGEGHVGWHARKASLSWSNTHLDSLIAMQQFMRCGKIRTKQNVNTNSKPVHNLLIERREDLLYVINNLIPYCLVKREALIELLPHVEAIRIVTGFGALEKLGAEEVRRLYLVENKTQMAIAELVGVSPAAVRRFMRKHNIRSRTLSEAGLVADRSSDAWSQRNEKLSRRRLQDWANPEYREKQSASMCVPKGKVLS
jgi:predicted transcriptional regulator